MIRKKGRVGDSRCAGKRRLDCEAAGRWLQDTRHEQVGKAYSPIPYSGKAKGGPITVMDGTRLVEVCSPAAKGCYRDGQEVRGIETSICKSFQTRGGFASIPAGVGLHMPLPE